MPAAQELIAHDRTVEEVCTIIGADRLIYQELQDLCDAVREGNPLIEHFDCSVFDGHYVTGLVDAEYLLHLESLRNDDQKHRPFLSNVDDKIQSCSEDEAVDLHNDR